MTVLELVGNSNNIFNKFLIIPISPLITLNFITFLPSILTLVECKQEMNFLIMKLHNYFYGSRAYN
jgi:hypothetical protein